MASDLHHMTYSIRWVHNLMSQICIPSQCLFMMKVYDRNLWVKSSICDEFWQNLQLFSSCSKINTAKTPEGPFHNTWPLNFSSGGLVCHKWWCSKHEIRTDECILQSHKKRRFEAVTKHRLGLRITPSFRNIWILSFAYLAYCMI